MFEEDINDFPYANFTISHSAVTNVINLSDGTSNNPDPLQPTNETVNSQQICNIISPLTEPTTRTPSNNIKMVTTGYIPVTLNPINEVYHLFRSSANSELWNESVLLLLFFCFYNVTKLN